MSYEQGCLTSCVECTKEFSTLSSPAARSNILRFVLMEARESLCVLSFISSLFLRAWRSVEHALALVSFLCAYLKINLHTKPVPADRAFVTRLARDCLAMRQSHLCSQKKK